MKKFFSSIMLVTVIFMTLAFILPSMAAAQETITISSFDVYVTVQPNNVYEVTENISVEYVNHGIYAYIPYRGAVYTTINGTPAEIKYNAVLKDISVQGGPFTEGKDGDNIKLVIGDPDVVIGGPHEYTISYKLDVGEDNITEFDQAYYNLIGTDWDAYIENANFTFEMPKDFDKEKIDFTVGGYGSTSGEGVSYTVQGNTIQAQTTRELAPYEGVTLRIELPEGYFVGESVPFDWNMALMIAFGALALLGIVLFIIFGIDEKAVSTVEFYAPEGLTSAEVGYIIDGDVDNKDVVSLIIYWADKGYLKIEQKDKDIFNLIKLKDLPESCKDFERIMFDGLFSGERAQVSTDELKYTFYKTFQAAQGRVKSSFTGGRLVFTPGSMTTQGFVMFFAIIPIFATIMKAIMADGDFVFATIIAVICSFFLFFPVYMLVSVMRKWRSTKPAAKMAKFIGSLALIGLSMLAFVLVMSLSFNMLTVAIVAAASTLLLGWLGVFMRKRTKKGTEWLGKILGLKDFINRAEKEKLKMMVMQDPQYFYR
ncbi:MAG: DUF2207 domain-containing protein, partial [Bacillota bacterium]|nr:DUF2207 domain-containing protein [Bacillota bacterium]